MNITEHSVTLISIIIGIGLTEMFGNLHRLIRNRPRVTCSTWATAAVVGTLGWNVISVIRGIILLLLALMLLFNKRQWDWAGVLGIFASLIFRLTTQAVHSWSQASGRS